jgi:hypothetical protein
MKLYKYKSLRNFGHVADIICNKRFYAAQYFELNDPMEGLFNHEAGTKKEYLDDIREGKKRLRICSFSKDPKNPLLWSHYADGFKGICIEVEINDNTSDFDIIEVEYTSIRVLFSNKAARLKGELPSLIFRQKAKGWSIEKEVRILSNNQYVKYGIKITGILLGLRTPDILKKTLIRLAEPDVKIWETDIGSTNKIVIGKQINSASLI